MAKNTLIQKILDAHIVSGEKKAGEPISIKIDQTLTQDATGTMAYLELEAMGVKKVATELSVSYVDHNMMQNGPENRNDHLYLQSVAASKGVRFSRPGNGICHQVHLERFGVPGKTLLGSDSHTPTGGGIGMMAIGAGGLDVALAMAGQPFRLAFPKIIGVELKGKLSNWVSAKDIILKMLEILSTKGNVGCMVEYFGEGVKTLTVPQRATITNMGAELGVTCSVCTNSSYRDLMIVAGMLKGRKISENVTLSIAPGSKQVLEMLARNGALADIISAGARILEAGCGPCIGQGQSPANDTVTLRTFNRNFPGRTGTKGDQSYLVSPETACAAALAGYIIPPAELGIAYPEVENPAQFLIDDSMVILPPENGEGIEIIRKPTIGKPPVNTPLPDTIDGVAVIKTPDKTSTDDIMPAGVHLKHRSNIPEYAKVVFERFNEPGRETFAQRAAKVRDAGKHGVIIGRDSYGQGSSREHAAICPMYLGIKVLIAMAIERIHAANLVNFGIVPLTFADKSDYDKISEGDSIRIPQIREALTSGSPVAATVIPASGASPFEIKLNYHLTDEDIKIILAGGRLNLK